MAKNSKRKQIGMVSTVSGHRSVTVKNTQNTTDKLKLKKFDPTIKKHVEFVETSKNLGRNVVKPKK